MGGGYDWGSNNALMGPPLIPYHAGRPNLQVVTIAGNWNYTTKTGTGANPKAARVTVVWKRYPKARTNLRAFLIN